MGDQLQTYVLLESRERSVTLLTRINSSSPRGAQIASDVLLSQRGGLLIGGAAVLLREDGEDWWRSESGEWIDMEPGDTPAPWLVNPYLNRAARSET